MEQMSNVHKVNIANKLNGHFLCRLRLYHLLFAYSDNAAEKLIKVEKNVANIKTWTFNYCVDLRNLQVNSCSISFG